MKKVFTAKDISELLAKGGGANDIPADAVLTPSARDALKEIKRGCCSPAIATRGAKAANEPYVPDYEFRWKPGADPKSPAAIQKFFNSPEIEAIKIKMCEMGRRMWERDYTDGNGGNLTVRVGDNLVVCTATLISKGFMKPDDICLVDFDGKQLAGTRKRTSEVLTHIAVMKAQPQAKACCHAHPPHATAFAVAKVQPPTCVIPEAEVFLGEIGLADYDTPGTPKVAAEVGRVAKDHPAILMVNHGVLTWGKDVEDAYWKMENTDSYCRTILLASQLGTELSTISPAQLKELLEVRKKLGMSDKREGWKECELCNNSDFRPGILCKTPDSAPAASSADAEALVQKITDIIMEKMAR